MTSHQSVYNYSSSKTSSGGSLSAFNYGDKDSSLNRDKVVVKNSDMPDDMRDDAIRVTEDAFEQFKVEKDIASHIKKAFDSKHGSAWHCIVGRNYGSYVTHETSHFIYMYVKQVAVLLFKSG